MAANNSTALSWIMDCGLALIIGFSAWVLVSYFSLPSEFRDELFPLASFRIIDNGICVSLGFLVFSLFHSFNLSKHSWMSFFAAFSVALLARTVMKIPVILDLFKKQDGANELLLLFDSAIFLIVPLIIFISLFLSIGYARRKIAG